MAVNATAGVEAAYIVEASLTGACAVVALALLGQQLWLTRPSVCDPRRVPAVSAVTQRFWALFALTQLVAAPDPSAFFGTYAFV